MKVEIIVDPSRIPPPPLTTRVGPAPKTAANAAKGKTAAGAAAARFVGTPHLSNRRDADGWLTREQLDGRGRGCRWEQEGRRAPEQGKGQAKVGRRPGRRGRSLRRLLASVL